MKHATLLFLLMMLNFLFAHAAKPAGNRKRIHELQKERRLLQGELKKLVQLQKIQKQKFKAIQKNWQIKYPSLSTQVLFKANPPSAKNIKPSLPPSRHIRLRKDSLLTDTNFLKSEIQQLTQQCDFIHHQIGQQNEQLAIEKQKLLQQQLSKNLLNKVKHKDLLKADKQLYYLQEEWKRRQQEALQNLKFHSYKAQLNQAQLQQQKLLTQMRKPGFQLPPGYQTKSQVKNNLPQNRQGLDPKQQLEQKQKFEEQLKHFNQIKDSLNQLTLPDSLWFKPNPYRSMTFLKRCKPTFSWQAMRSSHYYPARIEWMPGISYLLRPKLQPTAALTWRMGMGQDLEHMQITNEGFGLQAGINYTVYKQALLFISYDYSLYKNTEAEDLTSYQPKPGLILGLGIQGKIKVMLGYDFLQHYYPEKGSPWIIRFNF